MSVAAAPRRAAVLGYPIEHSRSPDLHRAAYDALGLRGWTYDRIECRAADLPRIVGDAGAEWVGFSVTMPAKDAALDFADVVTDRARRIGTANTLVRTPEGWRADNTDVDGVTGALREAGVRQVANAVLVGAGATARPALAALAELGCGAVRIVARDRDRAAGALTLARSYGLDTEFSEFATAAARTFDGAEVAISTVPAGAVDPLIPGLRAVPTVLDVVYNPWPTALAAAVEEAGGQVVSGLRMLLHQAFGQVEQFTGQPAPRAAMTAAIS